MGLDFTFYINLLQIQDGKEDLIDMVQKQKVIINELLMREPEKVKKLKLQKRELLQQQQTLKNQFENSELDNKKMAIEIEKLKSELKDAREENKVLHEETNQLKAKISNKDQALAKQKEILESTQQSYSNLAEEKVQLKSFLAEKDLINCKLRDEILQLREYLEESKKANNMQKEVCEQLKETVLILFEGEVKVKAENNRKETTINKLQEDIKMKDIQIWNIQQDMEEFKDKLAKSIAEIAITSSQKVVDTDEMILHLGIERDALKQKVISLEGDMDDAKKGINEAGSKLHDAEATLHEVKAKYREAETTAGNKLIEAEAEVKAAGKERAVIMEMLHASESAKSELTDVNRRMQKEISIQDEKIAAMEATIQKIMTMAKTETKRNENLIQGIGGVENRMQTIEGKMNQRTKSKMRRLFPFFCSA